MIASFELGGRDVAEARKEPLVVPPVDPLQDGELDLVDVTPRAAAANDLGLELTNHALGERVVVRVADGSDRGLDARLDETVGVVSRLG